MDGSPTLNVEDGDESGRDTEMIAEAKLLRQHKGRLEARMQILEDHNRQLEAQLQRLRQLLEQVSEQSSQGVDTLWRNRKKKTGWANCLRKITG